MAQLRNQAAKWQELWAGQQEKWSIFEQGFDLEVIRAPEILKAKDIRLASKTFKKRATAVEGWHPRHFGWMTDELLDAIGIMWHICDVQLVWPRQEEELLAKLIPKASGGLRPIM